MRLRSLVLLAAVFACLGVLYGEFMDGLSVRRPFDSHADKGGQSGSTLIQYHRGPILLGTVSVYVVYYGAVPDGTAEIVNDFFSFLGGSSQFAVNSTYYDSGNNFISGALAFAPTSTFVYNDNYSQGKSLGTKSVPRIVQAAIQGGHLPSDPRGVYFVITSPDVKVAGFCTSYCAYHTRTTVSGMDIKYALIPDPSQQCTVCDGNFAVYNQTITPNGDAGADEMTDSIMHELSETVTDPDISAWYTSNGAENGDLCNFNYGTTYLAGNGAVANAHLGKRDYLIQTIWQNTGAGFCANTK